MIKITFPDGNVKEFAKGTTAYQVAESISPRLAADCLAASVNGATVDMMRPIEEDVDRQLLHAALEKLSDREKQIILRRFGLRGCREQTQKEVADQMGISQSYISRLEKRIILRLKKEILKMS